MKRKTLSIYNKVKEWRNWEETSPRERVENGNPKKKKKKKKKKKRKKKLA